MEFLTWSTIKAKIKRQLDLQEQDFCDDDELLDYANAAIDRVEAEIHNLYQDYFLNSYYIPLVEGINEYVLPTDIYANKIRKIFYKDSDNNYYEVMPITLEETLDMEVGEDYKYLILNDSTNGYRIRFYPNVAVTSSTYLQVWYLRNAKRLVLDADACDLPEFVNYVIEFIRKRVLEKDGSPLLAIAEADLEFQRQLMIKTLQTRKPDNNNRITPELDLYLEHE